MSNKYTYKMTFLAESDIDSVLDYITNQLCNGQAASDLYFGIEKAIGQIREYPFAQADCKRFLIEDENIRHIPVDNYIWFMRYGKRIGRSSVFDTGGQI